jgi:subfamily B ATP-binding cassette protein MsbA
MEEIFKKQSSKSWKEDAYIVWTLTIRHLGRLVVASICGIVLSSINGAIAWLIKPSMDSLFVNKNRTIIYLLPIGVFILFLLRGIFTFANNFLMSSIGAKIVKDLRQSIYEKLLRLPMAFYVTKSSASLISRIFNDINGMESSIASVTKDFFVQSLTVLVLAGVALYRRWDLALVSFVVIPLMAFSSERFGKLMKKVSMKTRKLISAVTKVVQETITGIKVVKAFTMEGEMSRKCEKAVTEHYRNVMREVRVNEFTTIVMEVLAGLGVAIILWYGSYLILNSRMTVGEFFSFVAAVLMIYTPLRRLSKVNNKFQKVRTALHRIREIFMYEDEQGGDFEKDRFEGDIVYKDVTFCYPGAKEPAIRNVSFEVKPGERLAIVGFSGAGKSTLVDLMLGFWRDYEGEILIDGVNLKEYSLKCLRSHIGIVSQDIVLFDDTVKNKILFGKPDATDKEIIEASKAAYAHDFIMEMPEGYETRIGEKGIKLSGGQKQRIALARTILKNPKILILDEATSSLDANSEAKVQQALEALMPGRTTIIIAHRFSTIQRADKIVVLEQGKVVEYGRHHELIAREGVYYRLYKTQSALALTD